MTHVISLNKETDLQLSDHYLIIKRETLYPMSTLMIIMRATLMSLSPASHPIQLATPEQAKFQISTKCFEEKTHWKKT